MAQLPGALLPNYRWQATDNVTGAILPLEQSVFARDDASSVGTEDRISPQPSIVRLFFSCGPSAIFGRVGTVVIDAVERMAWRRFVAHVFVERYKRFPPTLAHRNTSATVVTEGSIGAAIATRFGANPRMIFRRVLSAMLSRNISDPVSIRETSATNGQASSQVVAIDGFLRTAARALHMPSGFAAPWGVWGSRYYPQSSKHLIGEIQQRHHSILLRSAV